MTFLAHYLPLRGVSGLCHAALTHVYTSDKLDMQCMPVHSKMYSAAYGLLVLTLSLHLDVQTISCTLHDLTCKQGPLIHTARSALSKFDNNNRRKCKCCA
ncbi:TPA: hypothetical protein ACH3X1_009442 [Trebouxia sp. C0004]